ncbi:hypothetical protein BJX99DRAFT_235857 [Aspergillus californicus]
MTEHGPTGGIFKENFLCVLIQIATVPVEKHEQLDRTMRSRDGDVNSIPGVTCRVWLFTIFEALMRDSIVRCSSVNAVQEDCMGIGNEYMVSAAANAQPRPVVVSRVCF